MTRLVELSGSEQPDRINPDNIPDKIVIIEEKNVPSLYTYGVALSWLAAIGLLAAVALLAWPYVVDRKNYVSLMMFQGGLLAAVGLVSLLLGPLLRPSVLEPFPNPDGRVVVGNLYDAFIGTFTSQTMILVGLGILVCAVGIALRLLPHVKKLIGKSA